MRYFSHIPAANAQVASNVSAAVRAFWANGYRVQYDGTDPRTGEKKFRAVTVAQEKATNSVRHTADIPNARGTTLEFHIAPTVTSISPLASSEQTLEPPDVLPTLASDFSRTLSSLALIHADLKRLATLGPLPVSHPTASTIHVRFPGCDAQIVTALCDELNIQRGIVREDEAWAEEGGDKDVDMALLFPWAPSASEYSAGAEDEIAPYFQQRTPLGTESLGWRSMLSDKPSPPQEKYAGSDVSELLGDNPWTVTDTGVEGSESFDAIHTSDLASNESFGPNLARTETLKGNTMRGCGRQAPVSGEGYEGVQGIYRFLAECEAAGR